MEVALRGYIKIGGLPGQSTNASRQDGGFSDVQAVELHTSTDWGGNVDNENVRTHFGGLTVTTNVNVASPQLMIGSMSKDKHDVELDVVNQEGKTLQKVICEGARISAISQGWGPDGTGSQTITFHCKKIKISCEVPSAKEDEYDFSAPQDFPPRDNPS